MHKKYLFKCYIKVIDKLCVRAGLIGRTLEIVIGNLANKLSN